MCTNKKSRHDSASHLVSIDRITKTNCLNRPAAYVSDNIFAQSRRISIRTERVVATRIGNIDR
jgi:hypothetical protein